jgi:hypothetical protein
MTRPARASSSRPGYVLETWPRTLYGRRGIAPARATDVALTGPVTVIASLHVER